MTHPPFFSLIIAGKQGTFVMPQGKYSRGFSAWRYTGAIKDLIRVARSPIHAYRTSSRILSAFRLSPQQRWRKRREFYAVKENFRQLTTNVPVSNSPFFASFMTQSSEATEVPKRGAPHFTFIGCQSVADALGVHHHIKTNARGTKPYRSINALILLNFTVGTT